MLHEKTKEANALLIQNSQTKIAIAHVAHLFCDDLTMKKFSVSKSTRKEPKTKRKDRNVVLKKKLGSLSCLESCMEKEMGNFNIEPPNVEGEDEILVSDVEVDDEDNAAKDASNRTGTMDEENEKAPDKVGDDDAVMELSGDAEDKHLNVANEEDEIAKDAGKVEGSACEDEGAKDAEKSNDEVKE